MINGIQSDLHWLLVASSLAFKYQNPRLVFDVMKPCHTWSISGFITYNKMRLIGVFDATFSVIQWQCI